MTWLPTSDSIVPCYCPRPLSSDFFCLFFFFFKLNNFTERVCDKRADPSLCHGVFFLKKPVTSGQCWQVPLLHSGGAKHHIHSFFVGVFKLELKEIWAAKRWLQKKKKIKERKKKKKSDSPVGEGADILCLCSPSREWARWRRRSSRCSSRWSRTWRSRAEAFALWVWVTCLGWL